jgi:hypothetical protein
VLKRYRHFIELEKVTCTNKLLLSYSNEVIKISITDFKRRLLSWRFLFSQSSVIDSAIYRDIFLTLNIAHTYSLCSVLKNTGQCMYVIT